MIPIMTDFNFSTRIADDLVDSDFSDFSDFINERIQQQLCADNHGDFTRWSSALNNPIEISSVSLDVSSSAISINGSQQKSEDLKAKLQQLIPWRKGPFKVSDIFIDCEWRSDFKWNRIKHHVDLGNKRVLDIGCGNGYHCWRMLEQKPKWVLGIDPNLLFNLQFRFINQYAQRDDIEVIPLGIEHLPINMKFFDTVFSMGVLYHRKSPMDHLYELRSLLAKGGELILETLVIDGGETDVLVPQGRYAKMKNVWFIPSVAALCLWLKKVGFSEVAVLDVSITTVEEQRATDWMLFESLVNYLDDGNPSLTIEGYPAPKRAVISAKI